MFNHLCGLLIYLNLNIFYLGPFTYERHYFFFHLGTGEGSQGAIPQKCSVRSQVADKRLPSMWVVRLYYGNHNPGT